MSTLTKIFYNRFFSKNPFFLVFYVTARCNAQCKMCYYWENIANNKNRKELTIDEIEKISKSITSLQQLTISGGEPFLRNELPEICNLFVKNSKAQFITIPTNGLLTDRIADYLPTILKQNPRTHFRIGLSMSAMGKDLDELYNVPNAFEKHQETFAVLSGLRKQHRNLNIDVGLVCNKFNIIKIKDTIDYVISHMPECNPIPLMVRGSPRFAEAKDFNMSDAEDIYSYCKKKVPKIKNHPMSDVMNIMCDIVNETTLKILRDKKMVLPCFCGNKLVVIYENGDVFPCELLDRTFGNLKENDYNLKKIINKHDNKNFTKKNIRNGCYCTWECAQNNNVVFNHASMLELFKRYLAYRFKSLSNYKE